MIIDKIRKEDHYQYGIKYTANVETPNNGFLTLDLNEGQYNVLKEHAKHIEKYGQFKKNELCFLTEED